VRPAISVGLRVPSRRKARSETFRVHPEGRGKRVWLTWVPPKPISEDEIDVIEEPEVSGEKGDYCSRCGAFGSANLSCACGESTIKVRLWFIKEGEELQTCFACGGRKTITPMRAAADAAQAVVAESFYRDLLNRRIRRLCTIPARAVSCSVSPTHGRRLPISPPTFRTRITPRL